MIIDLKDMASIDGLHANLEHVAEGHGGIVGLFAGAWDMLHAYHVLTLKKARDLCDFLIVGIGSDRLVRADKGPNAERPLYPEHHRLIMINAIRYVDACFIMDSESEYGKMARHAITPQYNGVHFKPESWLDKLDVVPEYDAKADYLLPIYKERRQDVEKYLHGNVMIVPDTISASSTTDFVDRILEVYENAYKGKKEDPHGVYVRRNNEYRWKD